MQELVKTIGVIIILAIAFPAIAAYILNWFIGLFAAIVITLILLGIMIWYFFIRDEGGR